MRERYIDIVKGLSIMCITLLHYVHDVFPEIIGVYIGSFMITAFYITSGWVSAMRVSNRTLKELIVKRWKQLGIPYLWWTIIILIFDFILFIFGYYDIRYIGKEIYKTITFRGIGTLWFLPALFGGEIIWLWLKKQNKSWLILLALIITIIYKYIYVQTFVGKNEVYYKLLNAPFRTLSNILEAWVGIAFGYYSFSVLKRFLNKHMTLIVIGLILSLSAFILANYLPSDLYMFWFLLAPLFGPLGLLLLIKPIQQYKWLDFFDYWGKNSLNLMVTHYSITLVLFTIFVEYGLGKTFNGWITLICFLFSLPIQYSFVKIIDKYAQFTLGK